MIKKIIIGIMLFSVMLVSINHSVKGMSSLTVSSTSDIKFAPTATFETQIFMQNPTNVIGFQLKILYDTSKYELQSIENGNLLTPNEFISNIDVAGEIIIVYVDVLNSITSSNDVTLFTLTFKALDAIQIGDNELISIDTTYQQEFLTIDENYLIDAIDTVNFTFQSVTRAVNGDLDLNGSPGLADVAKIQLYLANRTTLTELQLILADTNGDQRVSIIDAARIQLYVAGLITEL